MSSMEGTPEFKIIKKPQPAKKVGIMRVKTPKKKLKLIRERSNIGYSADELEYMHLEKTELFTQIKKKIKKKINIMYHNQENCARQITKMFDKRSHVNILVYGMTQTGKTGCMTDLIKKYILNNHIHLDHIYIITSLSDKEWKKDTKNRMPDVISSRVFHRANLTKKFIKDIKEKKNVLIIMDEIQIACKDGQTIYKTFTECGFYDLDFLLENDIKLVQFSATPDGNINDISDWKHHSAKVKLEPGEGYYGPKQAIAQSRIKQFKDLTMLDNVKELKSDIEGKFVNMRYDIIRVPNKRKIKGTDTDKQSIVINNFKQVFGVENYKYNIDYLKTQKDDINDILKLKPNKNEFIFICETYRCAKTIAKKFVGISYERYVTNPNDSSIIQGSFGRLTGYDDNGDNICYTNIPSIENYIKLWENDMEFIEGIEWNTKTTEYDKKDDITRSTGTFNSVKHIEQLKDGSSEKVKEDRRKLEIIHNNSFSIIKEVIWEKWRKRPRTKKPNCDGFIEATIKKEKRVYTIKEMEKSSTYIGDANNDYWLYPCYKDADNPKTLEWWLIYYE